MFERLLVDESEWEPIEEEQVRDELTKYYKDVDEIIFLLFHGGHARTYWAIYRYTKTDNQVQS